MEVQLAKQAKEYANVPDIYMLKAFLWHGFIKMALTGQGILERTLRPNLKHKNVCSHKENKHSFSLREGQ